MNESFTLEIIFFSASNIFLSWRNIYICLTEFLVLQPSVWQQLTFLEPFFLCFLSLQVLLKPSGCRENHSFPPPPRPWRPPTPLSPHPASPQGKHRAKQYLKSHYSLTWTVCLKVNVCVCIYVCVYKLSGCYQIRQGNCSPLPTATRVTCSHRGSHRKPLSLRVTNVLVWGRGSCFFFLMQVTAQHPQITSSPLRRNSRNSPAPSEHPGMEAAGRRPLWAEEED